MYRLQKVMARGRGVGPVADLLRFVDRLFSTEGSGGSAAPGSLPSPQFLTEKGIAELRVQTASARQMHLAQADLIELADRPICVFMVARPVSDIRIRNDLTFAVFAVEKPQFTSWTYSQNEVMQLLHLTAFWLRLARNILFDLVWYVHKYVYCFDDLASRNSLIIGMIVCPRNISAT